MMAAPRKMPPTPNWSQVPPSGVGRDEGLPVGRIDIGQAHGHEGQQHQQLDDDDDVVDVGGLADAHDQQQADHADADGGHQVEGAGGLEQDLTRLLGHGLDQRGGELRRRLAPDHDGGEQHPEVGEDGDHIARPADRHGGGGHAVLQHQQPAHDPGEDLAQGAVGIGVGGAGHRHGRGQLGVAQAGEGAGDARQHEGEDDGRAGMGGRHLAGQHEDARADDAADAETDQIDGTQSPFQLALGGFLLNLGDGFLQEQAVAGPGRGVCTHAG